MATKKEILLEGIKKLISLDVSDEEIIQNLREIEISEAQAKALIQEAKNPSLKESEEDEFSEDSVGENFEENKIEESAEDLDDSESLASGESLEESEKTADKVLKKTVSTDDFAKIWEKGILTTVNQNLEKMQKIQKDIDSELKKRSGSIAKKEIEKIQVLFESQRALTLEKVDSRLEEKAKELDSMLDAKIQELKSVSREIKKDIAELEKLKQKQKTGLAEIESQLSGLSDSKDRLVAEMNSELLKSKAKVEEFLANAEEKINDIDRRVSQTLELESNIVESLSKNAEEKISRNAYSAESELEAKFLERLEALRKENTAVKQNLSERISALEKKPKKKAKPKTKK